MPKHPIAFKRVVEYEKNGKRFNKVTGTEAKLYEKADVIRDTYESSPDVPSFAFFVAVDAKPKQLEVDMEPKK